MSAEEQQQQKLQLAVAKAAFSATLSAPGEPKVPAQFVASLQTLLTAVANQPSQRNVKEARKWILEYCTSAKQVTAAVRFLSAYSATLPNFKERLSMLYVMNDVLFHATNTYSETKAFVASASLPYLPVLVSTLRSAPNSRTETIETLLKLWSEKRYFNNEDFAQIVGERAKETKEEFQKREEERKPLVKPSILGTSGDPHWLLPVSCMLEVINYSNNYKPIAPMNVKAITLSERTDPDLLRIVESFESSIHECKFKEEEGSEGEEYDAEGWNMNFWKDRAGREQRRNEERIRQKALETIGRMKSLGGGKSSVSEQEVSRSRSPARRGRRRRSYSRSSDSRSRSRSPPRRRGREPPYTPSPPPRRRRSYSRSPPRSPSPRPRKKWSPPPRERGDRPPSITSQSHTYPPAGASYSGPPAGLNPSNLPPQPPLTTSQYPQHVPFQHQNPIYPSSSGYYRADIQPPETQPSSWNHGAQYPPSAPSRTWTQDPTSHSYGGNSSGQDYGRRDNNTQNRGCR